MPEKRRRGGGWAVSSGCAEQFFTCKESAPATVMPEAEALTFFSPQESFLREPSRKQHLAGLTGPWTRECTCFQVRSTPVLPQALVPSPAAELSASAHRGGRPDHLAGLEGKEDFVAASVAGLREIRPGKRPWKTSSHTCQPV